MKSNWIIDFVFVERSATNQSIKHINQSKTFDWMIEFDWIWLIAAPFAFSFQQIDAASIPTAPATFDEIEKNWFH